MEWRRSIDWSSPRTSEGSSVAGGMAKSSLSSTFAVAIVAELAVFKLWVESIDVIEYGFSEDANFVASEVQRAFLPMVLAVLAVADGRHFSSNHNSILSTIVWKLSRFYMAFPCECAK